MANKNNNEALSIIKQMVADGQISQEVAEKYFPELKESEDERIRKEMIFYFQEEIPQCSIQEHADKMKEFIAWLEKQNSLMKCLQIANARIGELIEENYYLKENQSEQKPADKVVPKYNVGDWLVHNERKNIVKIVNHTPFVYVVVDILGYHNTIINDAIENNYHLWTIKDAKPGDVLTDGDMFVIFKSNNYDPNTQYGCMFVYCSIMKNNESWYESGGHNPTYYLPATKEQRDTLFAKMKEAGYEWDAEKKELKKIEQKPLWSEEDELHIRELESLVKRVWATAERENDKDTIHKMSDLSFFLKTLKPQLKQGWCDEDEKYFNILISLANNPSAEGMFDYHKTNKSAFNNWLKSLKERYCPQKRWKPTKEQIGALEHLIDSITSSHTFILKELVKQLKEL